LRRGRPECFRPNLYARVRIFLMHICTARTGGLAGRRHPVFPCAPCVPEIWPECDNGRFSPTRPLPETEPRCGPKATEPVNRARDSSGVFPQPRTVARASSPYQARKGVDDDTKNDLVVVGIDVAKEQGGCMHSSDRKRSGGTFPTTASGRRSLIAWLRQASGRQGGDGGKRPATSVVWGPRRLAPDTALEVRIVDPKTGFAASRKSAGRPLRKKPIRSTRR